MRAEFALFATASALTGSVSWVLRFGTMVVLNFEALPTKARV